MAYQIVNYIRKGLKENNCVCSTGKTIHRFNVPGAHKNNENEATAMLFAVNGHPFILIGWRG